MFVVKLSACIASFILCHGYIPTLFLRWRWRRNVPLKGKSYLLTFDDGPSLVTKELIELLNHHQHSSVFFLLGSKLDDINLDLYQEHTIASHGYRHVNFALLDPLSTIREFQLFMQAFKEKGVDVCYFRAPYGLYNLTLIYLLKKANIEIVQWDDLLGDWNLNSPGVLYDRLKNKAKDGRIIVLHDATEGKAHPQAKWQMLEELERFLNEEISIYH